MSVNFQRALAGAVFDPLVADSEVKRGVASGAEIKTIRGKSLDEGLRPTFRRKPRGPDLHRLPTWISGTPASSGIHQQVPEPPRSAAARESHAKKPDLVTAPR